MAAVLSSNGGGGGGASTVDLEEEAQGLVTSRQTKRFRDSPEASGSSTSSLKCQIVSIFIFTSLFMLTVGYAVGRDSVGSKSSSETDKGTRPPTEELNGGDGNADGSKMKFDVDQLLSARAKAIDALDMLDKYWSPYSEKVLWGNTGLTFGELTSYGDELS